MRRAVPPTSRIVHVYMCTQQPLSMVVGFPRYPFNDSQRRASRRVPCLFFPSPPNLQLHYGARLAPQWSKITYAMKLTQDQAYSIIREAARDTATNHKDPHQRSASLIATTYSIYDITPSVSTPPINLGQEEDLFCALKAFISARVARAYPGESTFIKVSASAIERPTYLTG